LRLQKRERGILDGIPPQRRRPVAGDPGQINGTEIAARLFDSATRAGYRALGIEGGSLAVGQPADFFTVDLDDLAILGVDRASLVAEAVFALGRSAIRDVAVAGRLVIENGVHAQDREIRSRYRAVQKRFAHEEGQ
jgi:formimidoylglutamate deiminase